MLLETLGESQLASTDIPYTVIISYVALDNVHVAVISQARSQGGQGVNHSGLTDPSLLRPGLKSTFYPL